ncbi:MAG: thioredoxin [Planctomycetota bacterium]|nr:MAG: thioredoxin [Planctomycetota bacterium]
MDGAMPERLYVPLTSQSVCATRPWGGIRVSLIVCALCMLINGCEVYDEPIEAERSKDSAKHNSTSKLGPDPFARPETTRRIKFVESYETGLKRASDEGKPMLVVFRASWCRFSSELPHTTLADPQVVSMSGKFICVLVDADRDAAVCRAMGVKAFPTIQLISTNGQELERMSGEMTTPELRTLLREAIQEINVARGVRKKRSVLIRFVRLEITRVIFHRQHCLYETSAVS